MDLIGHQARRRARGYSLVELLLTMSLLVLFSGVAVVSLDSLNQRSTLTEGAIRFETLLRFARAEAENSGRRVRLSFVQDTNQLDSLPRVGTNQVEIAMPLNHVELTWEPNPVDQPEVFQGLQTIQWGVDQVNDLVGVSAVRLVDNNAAQQPAASEDESPTADDALPPDTSAAPLPSITFYPNGSCDSADITLADPEGKEDRVVTVRIEGLTGCVWRVDPAQNQRADTTPEPQPPRDLPAPAPSGQSD